MDMEKSVTIPGRAGADARRQMEHQESRTIPGAAVIKMFFQPGADPGSAMNDIVNLRSQ